MARSTAPEVFCNVFEQFFIFLFCMMTGAAVEQIRPYRVRARIPGMVFVQKLPEAVARSSVEVSCK